MRPYLYSSLYLDSIPLEYWARVLLEHVTRQSVTGSHMSRVSMSDVGLAVDWSQAEKVQNGSEFEGFFCRRSAAVNTNE